MVLCCQLLRLAEQFFPDFSYWDIPAIYTAEHYFTSDLDDTVTECTQAKLRWARRARIVLMSRKTDARSAGARSAAKTLFTWTSL
jgi:hypothetical protein